MKKSKIYTNTCSLPTHPIHAEITISATDLNKFKQLSEGHDELRIMAHDEEPDNGYITIYVDCTSTEVRELLEDSWQ